MGIFEAIVSFFANLLGSSVFTDALHKLFSELGLASDPTVYDAALSTASTALKAGASLADTIQQVSDTHSLPAHHAATVVAAAVAQAASDSTAATGA